MNDKLHPIVQLFQQRAELLDLQGSKVGLDDALSKLAAWMSITGADLNEDDQTVLGEIGAILYREGLKRRMGNPGA